MSPDSMPPDAGGTQPPIGPTRRTFIAQVAVLGGGFAFAPEMLSAIGAPAPSAALAQESAPSALSLVLSVNGAERKASIDPRTSLLDLLREQLGLTGTKKGCDHGQCGACTVLIDGRRVVSCLTLACTIDGAKVTTIEGLAQGDALHPLQAAFVQHDGFQCGYCTPGQICSAAGMLAEHKAGAASCVSTQIGRPQVPIELTADEIRERMSGNLCRCGAYPNIVEAIREAAAR
jgi:xanthine dehydrogenase YagT iron-sulfur-binding subunit